MKISFTLTRLPRHLLNLFFEVALFSLKRVWKMSSKGSCGSFLRISVIILEPVLRLFSYSLCPWIQERFNKRVDSSEKGTYNLTQLHPETIPVNRTILPSTTFIYVIPCISIVCNRQIEIFCAMDFFLNCNITRDGTSLSSNNTFSPVFVTKRIEIDL